MNMEWDERDVLSRASGCIHARMETPKTRGLAVKEIDGQLTEIDAYRPPDAAITLRIQSIGKR